MRRHQSTEIELSMEKAESLAEEIKSRCDIVDVIGRVVPLKKTGANLKGPCPFHKEADPSFVVSEAKQIFTCFGCGATGDVIGFVEKYYQMDFIQAAEKLADEYGRIIWRAAGPQTSSIHMILRPNNSLRTAA